jgi:hypothetical protein
MKNFINLPRDNGDGDYYQESRHAQHISHIGKSPGSQSHVGAGSQRQEQQQQQSGSQPPPQSPQVPVKIIFE